MGHRSHAPLVRASVHVVAVGLGADAADRAAPVLKHWTQDGDGTGTDNPTGQTQADPEIRQEIVRLKAGITVGNRAELDALGGFTGAAKRLKALRQLPEGTPTKTTTHGTIDRFQNLVKSQAHHSRAVELMRTSCFRPVPGQGAGQGAGQEKSDADVGGGVRKTVGGGVRPTPSIFRRLCSGF